MRKLVRRTGLALGGLLALWLLLGAGLALTPAPRFAAEPMHLPPGVVIPPPGCRPDATTRCFSADDGTVLSVLQTPAEGRDVATISVATGQACFGPRRTDSSARARVGSGAH
jgi:hypothetical protein